MQFCVRKVMPWKEDLSRKSRQRIFLQKSTLKSSFLSSCCGILELTEYNQQDLDSLKVKSAAIINELQEGLWIGRGTRFVSIDVTLYNPNLNYFCIIK